MSGLWSRVEALERLQEVDPDNLPFDRAEWDRLVRAFEAGADSCTYCGEKWTRADWDLFDARVRRGLLESQLEMARRCLAQESESERNFRGVAGFEQAADNRLAAVNRLRAEIKQAGADLEQLARDYPVLWEVED